MKHLSQYIQEGLFDDNVTNDITINGYKIDSDELMIAQKDFDKINKKYFKGKKTYHYEEPWNPGLPNEFDTKILYSGNDCAIFIDSKNEYIHIISPETIYFTRKSWNVNPDRAYHFKSRDLDLYKDIKPESVDFTYCYDLGNEGTWAYLNGTGFAYQEVTRKALGFVDGYEPILISNKARTILRKYY